jgi:uncharacterized protein YjbI with pentapeptide repeats
MIDHSKIKESIENYFNNIPTAKIIENLDLHSADRKEDLERENINHPPVNKKDSTIGKLVRFEEVSPANTDAAFLDASIESLVVPLGLPIYEGYDGLDDLRLTFLTLPSGETVTLASYLNSPQPGTSIHVDSAMQNIPQVIFESCQQLQVSREEAIWFHPDWQDEIVDLWSAFGNRLYTENGSIRHSRRYANEKRQELSQVSEPTQSKQYEPIDCFNHALRIYTREYVPATYWAMLQHNLGLAYYHRTRGERWRNLQDSIGCFNKSREVFTQDKFPEKWQINREDSIQSQEAWEVEKQNLIRDICDRQIPYRQLKGVNLSSFYIDGLMQIVHLNHSTITEYIRPAYLMGADLRQADFTLTRLNCANLSSADLSEANFNHATLNGAKLIEANLNHADLNHADLTDTNFNRAKLCHTNLSGAILIVADLSDASLHHANLNRADLTNSNLSNADLSNTDLRNAKLMLANLSGANLSGADVNHAQFGNNLGISKSMKQDLIDRGAIFDDASGDRSESKNLVPR